MNQFVIVGPSKSPFVEKISAYLNAPIVGLHLDWFADTEPAVRLDIQAPLANKTAVVIAQCDLTFKDEWSHRSINDHMAAFFHAISAVKQEGVSSIVAFLPYLPYARQEKDFFKRRPGPLYLWADFFKTAGIDHLITCDIHSAGSASILGSMLHEISIIPFWIERIKEMFPANFDFSNNLSIVSPDHGGLERAVTIAKELGCPYAFIDKIRISKDNPVALRINGDVSNRIAVIVDDIISTAKTASNACQFLHAHGVQSVIGCFTHAVFSPNSLQRLAETGFEKILIADTLTSAIKQVGVHVQVCSIADYVAANLQNMLNVGVHHAKECLTSPACTRKNTLLNSEESI